MASGRTISAGFLTETDKKVLELCNSISGAIESSITDTDFQKEFKKEYGKISYTRDGGLGLGGGKLQRDALCTRGRQGKAPFSNRNLRWHPLVTAEGKPSYAESIEGIEIEGEEDSQVLIFVVKESDGRRKEYTSDKVHEMQKRYVALPEHWYPHIDRLKHWSDTLWTQNSCVIPALEGCDWWNSVETYAVLGIALAVDLYGADFPSLYRNICDILKRQDIDGDIRLPSANFPSTKEETVSCPVCKKRISEDLEGFRKTKKCLTWQPPWRKSNRDGRDNSIIQIMHVVPLVEKEIRHNAANVRYGHKKCYLNRCKKNLICSNCEEIIYG